MARTTSDAVKGVLLQDYDTRRSPSLTAFIDTASGVTDDVEACASRRNKTLSTGRLELIERWLAAYYYTQSDPLYKSRRTADSAGDFVERDYKKGAIDLDSSGCLSAILKRQTAGLMWLGKPVGEQIDWINRNPGGG